MIPVFGNKYLKIIFCIICVQTLLLCLYTIDSIMPEPEPLPPSSRFPNWASRQIIQEYRRINDNSGSGGESDKGSSGSSCHLPQLEPFHPSILYLVNEELPPLICEIDRYPLLFTSTSDPTPKLIPVLGKQQKGVESCCLRKMMLRRQKSDVNGVRIEISFECSPLSLETDTDIPAGWEFVAVQCIFLSWGGRARIVDTHAFFHNESAKKTSSRKTRTRSIKTRDSPTGRVDSQKHKPVNVMVLALDGMSRMNFLRTMPEVHFFLKNKLSALEMRGYHKIGENTLPNMGPLLTKRKFLQNSSHLDIGCARGPFLDDCPLIWKEYKSAGYRTLFAEDGALMEIFNYHKFDFSQPPTDHYFRTMTLGAEKYTAHEFRSLSAMCYGPRPAFNVMMDYVEQMALAMERSNTPFFQFAMSGSVTHEFLNGGRLIVNHLLESLQRLDRRGVFNNTILILMSDHGSRIGDIRNHFQGFLEDRLPVLYIATPPWFQNKYPTAYANLVQNSKSLVTVWDIRQTLEDIVNLESIDDKKVNSRQVGSGSANGGPGISLFLPVPASRTCETAGIPEKFCTCNMKVTAVLLNTPIVKAGAEYAVEKMNSLILRGNFSSCALFNLNNVLQAEKISSPQKNSFVENTMMIKQRIMYRIVFETSPGDAKFEALLHTKDGFKHHEGIFNITAVTMGRLDVFKSQSWCTDDKSIKPFCYCLKIN